MQKVSTLTSDQPCARRIRIIALAGAKGSGKTTVANELQTGYGFLRFRFADPMKDMLAALYIPRENIDGGSKETPTPHLGGKSARVFMVSMGYFLRRKFFPEIFALATVRRIEAQIVKSCKEAHPSPLNIVIDDLRYPHELAVLKETFPHVEVWRVDNPRKAPPALNLWLGRRAWGRLLTRLMGTPVEEGEAFWPVFKADRVVENTGDMGKLYAQVHGLTDADPAIHKIVPARRVKLRGAATP